MSGLSIIVMLASLIVAEGSVETAPSSGLACSALNRIQLTKETVLIDGVPLGTDLYSLASVHRRDLDLRLHWGPLMDNLCGGITGTLPGDPERLSFGLLPGDGPLFLGCASLKCKEAMDLEATVAALREQLPELKFVSFGPPWTEELDESPLYVPPGREYYVGIGEEGISVALERCWPGVPSLSD